MWTPKRAELIRGRHLFEARRLLEELRYLWEGLSYFVYLLHVVADPWKVQCHHVVLVRCTAQKMKFSIKDFFSKCEQICSFHFLCSVMVWHAESSLKQQITNIFEKG